MDTTAISGISNAAAQAAPVSAPKPVAPVKAPERSSGAGGHNRSSAKSTKSASKEVSLASEESGHNKESEKSSELPVEETLIEIVSDSFDKGTELKVDRDDDTGRFIFQTVMKKTGEVIRQVPSEEMVALAKSLNLGNGVLVDKEA